MTLCSVCQQNAASEDGKCKRCQILEAWSTNTGPQNLGIIPFFKRIVPRAFKNFEYGFPDFHREILWEALQDAPGWKFSERQIAIAAPRGSSKTTLLSKGLALYCAAFAKKRYIVISSKTARAAQKNLRWIRHALGTSRFIQFFGDLRPDSRGRRLEIDEIEGVWSKEIVVLRNGVTIEAVGMGQQLRSSAEGEDVNRIDLFIADDTETDENTKTAERREDNEVWLFETVLPSLDVDSGTAIFINTMTHSESILAKLQQPNSGWRKKLYKITYVNDNGNEISLWPEKFSLNTIAAIRRNYELIGRLRSFYKEYYNEIHSDEGFSERWIRYWEGRVFEQGGNHWIQFKTSYDSQSYIKPCYLTLGIDLAFSQKEKSDFAVLGVVAQIPDGRKFLVEYVRGKLALYNEFSDDGLLVRKGIISEAIRLSLDYQGFDAVAVDATGTQQGTFTQIKKELQTLPKKPRVFPYQAVGEKFQRLKDLLQPEYETGKIHHQYGMEDIRRELVAFGDTTDDILDAVFLAIKFSKIPLDVEYNPIFSSYPEYNREDNLESSEYRDKLRRLSSVM